MGRNTYKNYIRIFFRFFLNLQIWPTPIHNTLNRKLVALKKKKYGKSTFCIEAPQMSIYKPLTEDKADIALFIFNRNLEHEIQQSRLVLIARKIPLPTTTL